MAKIKTQIMEVLRKGREIVPGYLHDVSQELIEAVASLLERLQQVVPRDVDFLHVAGNEAISALGRIEVEGWEDSYMRWQAHQLINLWWAFAKDPNAGLWVFPKGKAAEVSLFSPYPDRTYQYLDCPFLDSGGAAVIGIGPTLYKLEVRLASHIEWDKDQDFGWEDGYGEHVEYWDAARREYVRRSMSGRTYYTLLFDEEGLLKEVKV